MPEQKRQEPKSPAYTEYSDPQKIAERKQVFESAPRRAKRIVNHLKNKNYLDNGAYRVAIFWGEPGTGKTMTALAIADEMCKSHGWKCRFIPSGYIAEEHRNATAKVIRKIIDEINADNSPTILIFDEMNELLENTESKNHDTSVTSKLLWTFLTGQEGNSNFFCIGTMNRIDKLANPFTVALPNDDIIAREYYSSIVHFVDAARELNQANSPIEAMSVADVCWSILDCCKAAGEGVIQGTIGTVINHPIETALCVCAPQYLLAYHIGKIACVYLDVKITSLMDQEAGEQKLYDYMKPFLDCVDAICAGDITLRGSIKVAATVATQVVVRGRVDAGLKTFYGTTKKQAKNYLKNNPAATATQYLVTPDGRILQAAGGPGKNTMSLRDMGGKGPKNSSGSNKVPHVEKTRDTFKVGNIHEFFKTTEFGKALKKVSGHRSNKGSDAVRYQITKKIDHPMPKEGDIFYLDKPHFNHIEVFNSKGYAKGVINLDGTINVRKTEIALDEARRIKT